jgi:hypothetical protein
MAQATAPILDSTFFDMVQCRTNLVAIEEERTLRDKQPRPDS